MRPGKLRKLPVLGSKGFDMDKLSKESKLWSCETLRAGTTFMAGQQQPGFAVPPVQALFRTKDRVNSRLFLRVFV